MTHKQKCRVSMGQKWAKKRAKIWHCQTNNDQSQRSRQKNASWCLKMSNFSGKQQQKFKYYVSNSQSDKIWDVPKMWYQHNKFLRSNTRAWFCVNTWTIQIFPDQRCLKKPTLKFFWGLIIKWTGQSKNISKNTQQQVELAHKTVKIFHKNVLQ